MRSDIALMAGLALSQAVLELVLAARWIRAGGADLERGIVFLPLLGTLMITWGVFAIGLGGLYALFGWAALAGRSWAWPAGLAAVLVNLFAVGVLFFSAETAAWLAVRLIVPVILLGYLLTGRPRAYVETSRRSE